MSNDQLGGTIANLTDMIQKVGFPIVMVFVLSYIIFVQNREIIEARVENTKVIGAFSEHLAAQDKDAEAIKDMIQTACGGKAHAN